VAAGFCQGWVDLPEQLTAPSLGEADLHWWLLASAEAKLITWAADGP